MSKPLITIAQARERVLSAVTPLGTELVEIDHAIGRVLAAEIRALGDVPSFASSAMDGYAVIAGAAGRTLQVVGESRAGTPIQRTLGEGEAIRISTGGDTAGGRHATRRDDRDRGDDRPGREHPSGR
jgi:molybdopterin molybdotransferase